MTFLSLSFRAWPYPTKHRKTECCAWGECGFLSYSIGNSVTIYSNEIGRFSPMYMWCPFESTVTCMGWYDGSCTPSIVQPLLAIGTKSGKLAVFDVRNKNILGTYQFKADTPISVLWSPFYRSRLYVGSKKGFLYCLQMNESIEHNVAMLAEIDLGFNIDFIASDPQTGTTIAVASKCGKFTIISSILQVKSTDTFKPYNLNLSESDSITTLSFFPDFPNFIVISTTLTSYLFSINEGFTIPYIKTEGIRFISSPSKLTNRIIIGYDDAISLWQYNDEGWSRLHITTFVPMKGLCPEAKLYATLDDKVIVFTESHWLTVIEEHHDKLFIVQRIRTMPSKPLDWDFRKGSIAFATQGGDVLCTSWTPDAIIQPKTGFGEEVSIDDLAASFRNAKRYPSDLAFNDKGGQEYNIEEYNNTDLNDYRTNFKDLDFKSKSNFSREKNTSSYTDADVDYVDSNYSDDSEENISNLKNQLGDNKKTFSQLMDGNGLEVDVNQDDFEDNFDFSSNFVSVPTSTMKNSFLNRSSKSINADVKKIWKQMKDGSYDPRAAPLLTLPAEFSADSDYSDSSSFQSSLSQPSKLIPGNQLEKNFDQPNFVQSNIPTTSNYERQKYSRFKKARGEPLCGNSNTLLLCFKASEFPIDHVMWGPGGRLIVWSFFNNKNHLKFVDFKKRESKTLLSMQLNAINVPITHIFFSFDRSIFCIIIGELTAVFMSISSTPRQIGSLTFNSPVIGAFASNGTDCVFISKDSLLHIVSVNERDGAAITKSYRFPRKKGEPTFISWINNDLIIGTSLGKVGMYCGVDFTEHKSIITITNPVDYVYQCDNNTFFIMDNEHNAVLHSSREDVPIKGIVKNIKPASQDAFLMKISGSGKLTVLSINGRFNPLPPPCISRCPLVLGADKYQKEFKKLELVSPDEAIKACRLFGVIFIMRLIQAKQNPNALSEHVSWLNGLISGCVQFSSWAISLALKVGDNLTARNILLMTSPTDPNFMANLTKAALFDAQKAGESVEMVTKTLFDYGKEEEAIDLMLITGDVESAVKYFCDQGKIRDAAMLLRMRKDKKKHLELYHKIATQLIEQRKLMLGLLMLSEGGFNGEMIGLISSIIGVEFSHIVSFLDEEEIHY